MATRANIVTQVLQLAANNAMISSADGIQLVQTAHETILNDYSWTRRKAYAIISLAGPYSTGTVSTTAESTTVTGSGTTFTSAMIGRFIRIGSRTYFHRIIGFTSTTSVTIENGFPDAASGETFTIFKHIYNLPSDFGRALSITADTRLSEWPAVDLDRMDPYRTGTASTPDMYSIRGLDPDTTTSQIYQIEVWPVPAQSYDLRMEYLRNNDLALTTDEPLYRSDVLVWKSAEQAAFFLHGKTGDAAWLALADRWHERYKEALQGAREDDLGKYSAAIHVRDRGGDWPLGDDWFLNHDPLILR